MKLVYGTSILIFQKSSLLVHEIRKLIVLCCEKFGKFTKFSTGQKRPWREKGAAKKQPLNLLNFNVLTVWFYPLRLHSVGKHAKIGVLFLFQFRGTLANTERQRYHPIQFYGSNRIFAINQFFWEN